MNDQADQGLIDKINAAHRTVEHSEVQGNYKMEAFKIVLTSLLPGAVSSVAGPKSHAPATQKNQPSEQIDAGDWQTLIASKLHIESEDVVKIYHMDGQDSLRLSLKNYPKAQSAATQDIAALISAGRQAAQLDDASTNIKFIREESEYYGRLNKPNFTSYLKKMMPDFRLDGKELKVTAHGFDVAGEVAKKYLKNWDEGKEVKQEQR